jgi:hypothetical protein
MSRVVAEFREKRPEYPLQGFLNTEFDPGETVATCHVCGYYGIVRVAPKVKNAALPGGPGRLVCSECAEGGDSA